MEIFHLELFILNPGFHFLYLQHNLEITYQDVVLFFYSLLIKWWNQGILSSYIPIINIDGNSICNNYYILKGFGKCSLNLNQCLLRKTRFSYQNKLNEATGLIDLYG